MPAKICQAVGLVSPEEQWRAQCSVTDNSACGSTRGDGLSFPTQSVPVCGPLWAILCRSSGSTGRVPTTSEYLCGLRPQYILRVARAGGRIANSPVIAAG